MAGAAHRTFVFLHKGGSAIRGSERCAIETIAGLIERDVRVVLVASHPELLVERLPAPPTKVIPFDYPELMFDQGLRLPLGRYFREKRRLLGLLAPYAPALLVTSGGLPCQLGLPLARRLGVPIVCQLHHPAPRRFLYLWLVRWVDRLITPSRHTHDSVLSKCGRESTVVHLGADVAHTYRVVPRDPSWRARLGIAPDTLVVMQVGALVLHKRLDLLVRAVALLRGRGCAVQGVIIGEGPERGRIERLIASLCPGSVTLLGRVPEVAPYLQHVADVHALISSEEGFGISVIEAAGCGLPNVVATPGALEEVVADGVDGFHVPGGDAEVLAERLERLYRDPERRRAMGRAAAKRANEDYSIAGYRERMIGELFATLPEGRAQH